MYIHYQFIGKNAISRKVQPPLNDTELYKGGLHSYFFINDEKQYASLSHSQFAIQHYTDLHAPCSA